MLLLCLLAILCCSALPSYAAAIYCCSASLISYADLPQLCVLLLLHLCLVLLLYLLAVLRYYSATLAPCANAALPPDLSPWPPESNTLVDN